MKDVVPSRTVPLDKIVDYLLDPAHPAGGPKAVFFKAFGFTAERWHVLSAALIEHPDQNPIDEVRLDRWGVRFAVPAP